MDFIFTPEQHAFRRQVQQWFAEVMTPEYELELERRHDERGVLKAFSKRLADQGWLTHAWPVEYGGGGKSHVEQAILNEAMGYWQAPNLAHIVGVELVGPTLMVHGTEEQKRRYLPPIARMEHVYAQGFTEPDAGSDVAALQTRAVEQGDSYLVTGQKIWIGNAHIADLIYLAVRTDPTQERHRGISLLIVPLDLPGITVRPIRTLDGHYVNAVFFDDVVVPKDALVGEKNRGWYAMVTTLDFERSGIGGASSARRNLEDLVEYARTHRRRGQPILSDPLVRHRCAEFAVEIEAWRLLCWRVVGLQARGLVPTAEGTMTGIIGKTLAPRLGALAIDILGKVSSVPAEEPRWAALRGRFQRLVVRSVLTHPGGTPEILKNVLATRGLGLPRS
ncbi:MAG: acyl-CoA dehydrogenase family protein [Firmicutes bacterium]|jgi:alkylation response protein AidB-like acyl-CoA dehydrogenase|nr:acyl-CoA dehydrogenase family protein [Bacillota bacterium]